MTDGIGTTSYGYLAVTNTQLGAGQLASVDGPLANDTITYTYDVLGRTKSQAINGIAQIATFDTLGRVTVITNALGSFTNNYLNETPLLSSVSYPNGQITSFSYYDTTNALRLQTIWHQDADTNTISFGISSHQSKLHV
jgi:hypothetical protein